MVPYSTLLVYSFQPSFGFNVVESYRFSVAGLFQSSLTLNATIVPYTSTETIIENRSFMKEMNVKPIHISNKAQDKTRVELSFTGVPDSTVGLNVFEYDGILQGLSNEITKERLLKYLTTYEHVPIVSIPTMPLVEKTVRYQRQMGSNLEMDDGQGGMHGPPNGQNPGEMPVPPNGQNPGAQGEMPVPPNGQNPGAQGEMPVPPNGQNPGAQGGMPVPPNGPSGSVPPMNGQSSLPNNMPSEMPYPTEHFPSRRTISEEDEQEQIHRERMVLNKMILFLILILFFRVITFVIQLKKWSLVFLHHTWQHQLKVMIFIQHQTWADFMVIYKVNNHHHIIVVNLENLIINMMLLSVIMITLLLQVFHLFLLLVHYQNQCHQCHQNQKTENHHHHQNQKAKDQCHQNQRTENHHHHQNQKAKDQCHQNQRTENHCHQNQKAEDQFHQNQNTKRMNKKNQSMTNHHGSKK
jgi:hypothetical protein